MNSCARLGLGTVQFGLDYGVSNPRGKVPVHEVQAILAKARETGIGLLDTAAAYGNSESVLGELLDSVQDWQIVTKTVPLGSANEMGTAEMERLDSGFSTSLSHLLRPAVYALLVHHARDLLLPGGDRIYEWLCTLKETGQVKRIGVSVYDQMEIEAVCARYQLDVVQLPINAVDQRLIENGSLAFLKSRGIEIHARSIFLQGLLLMPLAQVPQWFTPILPLLRDYHEWLRGRNLSPLEGALAFVKQQTEIDRIIVGAISATQLSEIVSNWSIAPTGLDYSAFRCSQIEFIDPRQWKH